MRYLSPVISVFVAIMLMAFGLLDDRGPSDPPTPVTGAGLQAPRHENQAGHVVAGGHRLSELDIRRAVERYDLRERAQIFIWDVAGVSPATASARGLDGEHHFVNSYLLGFEPFEVDSPVMPMAVLARRKEYRYDHEQYDGLIDVWQNSRESYLAPRGDCEDHAILLADWLIEMGLDARVAVGTYRGTGHAWVVVVDGDRQYLLEATDKRRRYRALPRVELTRGYAPQFQFNQQHFWVNTGARATRDYAGPRWERRSRFVRRDQNA